MEARSELVLDQGSFSGVMDEVREDPPGRENWVPSEETQKSQLL